MRVRTKCKNIFEKSKLRTMNNVILEAINDYSYENIKENTISRNTKN